VRAQRRGQVLVAVLGRVGDGLAGDRAAVHHHRVDRAGVVAVDLLEGLAEVPAGLVAEQLLDRATGLADPEVVVDDPVDRGHLADHEVEHRAGGRERVALAAELGAGGLELGDIEHRRVEPRAVGIFDEMAVDLDGELAALPGPPAHACGRGVGVAAAALEQPRGLVGIDEDLAGGGGEQLVGAVVTDEPHQCCIDVVKSARQVTAKHPDRRAIEQSIQLAVPKRHPADLYHKVGGLRAVGRVPQRRSASQEQGGLDVRKRARRASERVGSCP